MVSTVVLDYILTSENLGLDTTDKKKPKVLYKLNLISCKTSYLLGLVTFISHSFLSSILSFLTVPCQNHNDFFKYFYRYTYVNKLISFRNKLI